MPQPPLSSSEQDEEYSPLLRPAEQASVLVLVGCSLLLIGAYWLYCGGHRGKLIEIDRAAPFNAQFLVDVNEAEWPELAQLPGIGPKLAARMIQHRSKHGNYRQIDQLTEVDGIGPRTLEAIRPYLIAIPADDALVGR